MKQEEFTYNPVKRLNTAIINTLDEKKVPSPILIIISFVFYIAASVFFAVSDINIGAVLLLIGGIVGLISRQIQKKKNLHLPADSFMISVIERYSDIFIFFGFIYRYVRMGELLISLVSTLALVGCILLSYTGLRKELTDKRDSIGFMRRTERIAIIIIGAFMNHIVTALYIIAILSNLDALIRIFYIYRILKVRTVKS